MDHLIIAVDFDGTLCYSNWPDVGEPNTALIEYLKTWKKQGNKLILWTCRAGAALDLAVHWCRQHDDAPRFVGAYATEEEVDQVIGRTE